MSLIITRFANHPKLGCPGELTLDGDHLAQTMEREWNDNKPYISCVPVGTYKLIPHHSDRYGDVFMMVNPELNVYAFEADMQAIDDRFKCYAFHRGSYPGNFEGCVGAGQDYMLLGMEMGINNTRQTAPRINKLIADKGITELEIRWKYD